MCEIYRISIDLLQNSYTFLDMAIKQVDFYMVSDYNYIIVNTIKYMSFNQKDYSVKVKLSQAFFNLPFDYIKEGDAHGYQRQT